MNPRLSITLIFAAVCCTLAAFLPLEQLTFFLSDDAYYYLNVARNITRGAGSSFDGLNPSNGYHPLWMLCLLPVYSVFGGSLDQALRAVMMEETFILAATLWLAWGALARLRANRITALVAIAIVGTLFSPVQIMFNGLETDLVILVLVAILAADARRGFLTLPQPAARQALFGLLLGLLMLARLDEAFLIVGIAIWSVLDRGGLTLAARVRDLCRAYAITMAVFAVVVAPYFVWNFLEFQHLSPISGTLKSTFPHPVFRTEVILAYAPYVGLTLVAALALIPMWRRPTQALPRPHVSLWIGATIGCLLQVGWAVFFTSWGTFQWHFAAHIPMICFILSAYAARLMPAPTLGHTLSVGLAVGVAVLAFNLLALHEKGDYHDGAYSAAQWALANTPAGTVFALRDAGVFGYFSDRPTINLDGLINSYEYQQYVREGRLMEFLRERHVRYVADAFARCQYTERHVWVRPLLPPRPPPEVAYGLTVSREAEAFRSAEASFRPLSRAEQICFIVWPFDTVTYQVRDVRIPRR
jgi:hypothetical protein